MRRRPCGLMVAVSINLFAYHYTNHYDLSRYPYQTSSLPHHLSVGRRLGIMTLNLHRGALLAQIFKELFLSFTYKLYHNLYFL